MFASPARFDDLQACIGRSANFSPAHEEMCENDIVVCVKRRLLRASFPAKPWPFFPNKNKKKTSSWLLESIQWHF
jgi:hypothetical protein